MIKVTIKYLLIVSLLALFSSNFVYAGYVDSDIRYNYQIDMWQKVIY